MQLCRSNEPCSARTPAAAPPSLPTSPGSARAGSPPRAVPGLGRQGRLAGTGLAAGGHPQGYKKQECHPQQQDTEGNACQPGRGRQRCPSGWQRGAGTEGSQHPSQGCRGAGYSFGTGARPKGLSGS